MAVPTQKAVEVHINDLPYEVLEEIFSYLNVKQKFICERVCRYWQQNVFNFIHQLVFEGWDDELQCCHRNSVRKENRLPHHVNEDDEIMKRIISKCGRNLRFYKGIVNLAVIPSFVEHCVRLQCIDIHVIHRESLQLISEAFGKQLSCATLWCRKGHEIKSFLSACPNLTSFAVTSTRSCWLTSTDDRMESFDPYDFYFQELHPPQSLALLKQLIMKPIDEEVLSRVPLMTNLSVLSVKISQGLNSSAIWMNLTQHWPSGLKSLTIEVCYRNCVHFKPLPPNLEYLHLRTKGFSDEVEDTDEPIQLSSFHPKLQVLKIFQPTVTSARLGIIIESVLRYCPAIQDLYFGCSTRLSENVDDVLNLLVSATSLKRLSLGPNFDVSDVCISNLISNLPHLISIGDNQNTTDEYLMPNGPMFWNAVIQKAKLQPSVEFKLTGVIKDTLTLRESLPANVYLSLQSSGTIILDNGFGSTNYWQEMVKRFTELSCLDLEVHDVSYNLSGLPEHLNSLTIKCLRNDKSSENDALKFNIILSSLKGLTIFQQFMSNDQLQQTVDCIVTCCPKLESLCIDRDNETKDPIDEKIVRVFECKGLKRICFSNKLRISDEFGAKLAKEMENLQSFGCDYKHQLGFEVGPLFLKALVAKAASGTCIMVTGGPTFLDVVEKIGPLKIPRKLRLFPLTLPVRPEPKEKPVNENVDIFGLFT